MDNKEYKAIIKKGFQRCEQLQKLEINGKNVFVFIGEFIYRNQLKEFFCIELLPNYETQIYFIRKNEKIPVMKVGNRVIKTNLTKRLNNLLNYLNQEEKYKYDFIKKLEKLKWKYIFDFDKEIEVNKLILKNYYDEYLTIYNPLFYYGMINFQKCEIKTVQDDTENENNLMKWKSKSYTIENRTLDRRRYFKIEDLELMLNEIRKL